MLAASLRASSDSDRSPAKLEHLLLLVITAAGVAVILLSFQHWVDFEITKLRGTDADAATGISDGWFVAGLGVAIVLLAGGVLFRPQTAPFLLPAIAVAAICVLGIAGYDAVSDWPARGVSGGTQGGVLSQVQGDPTIWLYTISALAIIIAVSAAVLRGIQLRRDQPAEVVAN
jgi:hypothetical protein